MQKLILAFIGGVFLTLSFSKLASVHAAPRIISMNEVQPGMNIVDVLAGLKGSYTFFKTEDVSKDMRRYTITGGPDARFYYEIFSLKNVVASVWSSDAKVYSGDASPVSSELFDALYAAGTPRRDKVGDVLGIRNANLSIQLQKPESDSSSRSLIFQIPGEDFRIVFVNGEDNRPSLLVQRVRSLDDQAFGALASQTEK